jgi:GTP-sensing pleiotropic transcriptional regulator CodY
MALSDFDFNGALNTVVGGWASVEQAKQAKEAVRLSNTQANLPSDQTALTLEMERQRLLQSGGTKTLLVVGGLVVVGLLFFAMMKK